MLEFIKKRFYEKPRAFMKIDDFVSNGLLGYQPIFLPNGVISGTGYQFFGNLALARRQVDLKIKKDIKLLDKYKNSFQQKNKSEYNHGQFGNIYIPQTIGNRKKYYTEFYFPVKDEELYDFIFYNQILLQLYEHYVSSSLDYLNEFKIDALSVLEIGCNTGLFPFLFSKAGIERCIGADIVDYSNVINFLSNIYNEEIDFIHMGDDSDQTWRSLPKTDVVWSYAVLLHQSNPLIHLTRLASTCKKAMFVMTLTQPDELWKSDDDMCIKYISANSYYNAEFPNCFDVSIVSPKLVEFSLKRLGFDKIVKIPPPTIDGVDKETSCDLDYWIGKHCFYLAIRGENLDDSDLNDYSVATERSPHKGENILVHTGYHNNVVLRNTKYFIVPHGIKFPSNGDEFTSFKYLNNALEHLSNIPEEKKPYPILMREMQQYYLIRFRNRYWAIPIGEEVNFDEFTENYHSLDTLEKFEKFLSSNGEKTLGSLGGILVDSISDYYIIRTETGSFKTVVFDSKLSEWNEPKYVEHNNLEDLLNSIIRDDLKSYLEDSFKDEVVMIEEKNKYQIIRKNYDSFIFWNMRNDEKSKCSSYEDALDVLRSSQIR